MKQRTLGIVLLFFAVVLFLLLYFNNDTFLIFAIMLIMVLWLQISGGWKPKVKSKTKRAKAKK